MNKNNTYIIIIIALFLLFWSKIKSLFIKSSSTITAANIPTTNNADTPLDVVNTGGGYSINQTVPDTGLTAPHSGILTLNHHNTVNLTQNNPAAISNSPDGAFTNITDVGGIITLEFNNTCVFSLQKDSPLTYQTIVSSVNTQYIDPDKDSMDFGDYYAMTNMSYRIAIWQVSQADFDFIHPLLIGKRISETSKYDMWIVLNHLAIENTDFYFIKEIYYNTITKTMTIDFGCVYYTDFGTKQNGNANYIIFFNFFDQYLNNAMYTGLQYSYQWPYDQLVTTKFNLKFE